MMIILLSTSLLLVLFQTNFYKIAATSTNKTTGQPLDDSILKLQQNLQRLTAFTHDLENEYKTLKREVISLRKLHGSCVPCKESAKDTGVCDCTDIEPRKDCLEFYQNGHKINGVYRLQKGPGFHWLHAFCDQTTQGGGWTVFQRRQDGSVDFNRNWNDYKDGFGNLDGEFWFGNDNIHDLTKPSFSPKKSQLLINMRMKGHTDTGYAKYKNFEVTDGKSKYALKISDASGNVTDMHLMHAFNNTKFTTFDYDNSGSSAKCASRNGGWWYRRCYGYLNAQYTKSGRNYVYWDDWEDPLEFVEMKVKRNL